MKIGMRLLLAFGAVLLLMVVNVAIGFWELGKAENSLEDIVKFNMSRVVKSDECLRSVLEISDAVSTFVLIDEAGTREQAMSKIQAARSKYKAAVTNIEELNRTEEGKQLLEKCKDAIKAAAAANNKAIELTNANKRDEAIAVLKHDAKPLTAKTGEAFEELTAYQLKRSEFRFEGARRTGKRAKTVLIVSGIAALLLGIGAAITITRMITRPLLMVGSMAERIAAGDLTAKVDCAAKDEIGVLSRSINSMAGNLSEIVTHITESSCSVAAAATQLQWNTEQISVGVREVEQQAITLGTASEEMASTSADIARNCHMAASNSARASEDAKAGVTVVNESINDMLRIADRVRSSTRTVEQLGSRSEQIGAIVGTIEDIADQTNLLALNAAIEAARAGDQGRGFAVVADEVRALAERTTKATHEISSMIRAIQTETRSAVGVMAAGVEEVERGMETSRRSEKALEGILASINEVTNQIDMIATAAEEQTATTQEIAGNIQRVSDVLENSSQSSNQNVAAVAQLTKLAEDLIQRVREFKVAGNEMLILQLAKNDHKIFVNNICSAVLGNSTLEPAKISTHETCRFGKWYNGEGKELCGNLTSFKGIENPHMRIHSIARDAVNAVNSGNESKAKDLLKEVEKLSHEMVDRLDQIGSEYVSKKGASLV